MSIVISGNRHAGGNYASVEPSEIFSNNRARITVAIEPAEYIPAYSEEQELAARELAGSCCTFKCMISRVKQQLGGSDLHNSAANTP